MGIFILIGFKDYVIKDKIMYRKSHKVKDKLCGFRFISERKIKISKKNGVNGYYLVRNKVRKFYQLSKLKHRLKNYETSRIVCK